jgi:hypothetical protein
MKIASIRKPNSVELAARIFILTVFLALSAFVPAQSPGASQGARGPKEVRFDAVRTQGNPPVLEPGKALIYVSEVFKKVPGEWGNPTIRIGLDGAWMGATRANSYVAFSVDPGEHHLCTNWQSSQAPLARSRIHGLQG